MVPKDGFLIIFFFFSSRRRHTRYWRDWSSDVCSSDLGTQVGGDWYDVVEVGDALVLVVGDVVGHGVQAAAVMGQLQATVRAYALDGHGPAAVLTRLDR